MKFLNKCGADQTCRADLLLQGRVLHVPSEMGLDLNVVNSTSEVVLDLTLTNRQETAYGIKLTVNVQGQIRFITATGLRNSVFVYMCLSVYVFMCMFVCILSLCTLVCFCLCLCMYTRVKAVEVSHTQAEVSSAIVMNSY